MKVKPDVLPYEIPRTDTDCVTSAQTRSERVVNFIFGNWARLSTEQKLRASAREACIYAFLGAVSLAAMYIVPRTLGLAALVLLIFFGLAAVSRCMETAYYFLKGRWR